MSAYAERVRLAIRAYQDAALAFTAQIADARQRQDAPDFPQVMQGLVEPAAALRQRHGVVEGMLAGFLLAFPSPDAQPFYRVLCDAWSYTRARMHSVVAAYHAEFLAATSTAPSPETPETPADAPASPERIGGDAS